jgi:hypothetical protein
MPPKYPKSAAPLIDIAPNQATPISAATSSFVVFNEDALTAADYPKSPNSTISDDDAQAALVHVQAVPTGASALDLYVISDTTPFSTSPVIRVFGEIPLINTPQIDSPHYVDASVYENPTTAYSSPQNQWLPLSDEDGNYAITMPVTTAMETPVIANAICEAKTIHTRGCKRVIVLVETPGVGPSTSLIAGCFVY